MSEREKIENAAIRGEMIALRGSLKAERIRADDAVAREAVASETVKALLRHKEDNEHLRKIVDVASRRIVRLWFVIGFESVALAAVAGALVIKLLGGS